MAVSPAGSRPGPTGLRAVAIVCLVLTAALSAPALATGSLSDADSDPASHLETGAAGSTQGDADGNETIRIDDSLESADGTVEVVVRFEEATIPDAVPDDDATDYLEDHAAETQAAVLDYAERTPGVTVETEFWVTNAALLTVDTDRVDLETFDRFPAVEAVHENFAVSVPERPSLNETALEVTGPDEDGTATADADLPVTSGLELLNAPAVWDEYDTRGEGVRVAVLDTGIDASHPDLELYTDDPSDPTYPGGWAEFDAEGNRIEGSTPYDSGIHGTHVSGTVAGGAASGSRIGVAPDAELLHGLVLRETSGSFAQIVAGMEWALEADADVINLSLGAAGRHGQLIDPVRNARESGVVVVAAVGNEGVDTSNSPANVYEAISVGAVDEVGAVPAFSGGERVERAEWTAPPSSWPSSYATPDLAAPGVRVASSVPGGGYESLPGTSMATPHVAGAVALLASIEPTATPDEIEAALYETAWKPDTGIDGQTGTDVRYGRGIVDVDAAADALATSERRAVGTTSGSGDVDPDDGLPESLLAVAGGIAVAIALGALLFARSLARDLEE